MTNNPANDDDAVFTPDGKQIVFDTARAGGNNADIWIMDADGRSASAVCAARPRLKKCRWSAPTAALSPLTA
ncbi:MAG: PD40 domain-containing protein [Planctomycetes bacterium]|nr:PD40 domain-containing protein [Planctomycetota bacterium]